MGDRSGLPRQRCRRSAGSGVATTASGPAAEVLGPEWRSGRVTARALPVTRGILHRRFEDALSEADSRIISVAFLDSAAKTPGILHRHIEVAAAARQRRGYRTVSAPRERRVCAITATPLPSFMWRAMSVA